MKNELNHLQHIKYIQELTQEKIDQYVYITYKQIWRLLQEEKRFFLGYRTFLNYIGESKLDSRIKELQNKNGQIIAQASP